MHAHFEELLAFRDGEPVDAAVRRHIERCAQCAAEARRLQALKSAMRRLPSFEARSGWPEVRARLSAAPSRPSRYVPALATGAVMAACLAAFVAMLSHRARFDSPALPPSAAAPAREAALSPLVAHSQRLEALLHALPPRPAAEKAVTSAAIDELENRIRLLDLRLSGGVAEADQVRLWNARVQLLNSLVYVRYAESAGNGRAAHPLELGVI